MAETLGDLVAPDRRSDRVALRSGTRTDTYREVRRMAWKAAHALRYLGVHEGSRVALAPDPSPPVVVSLLGAASLGARVTMDPSVAARVAVVPAGRDDGAGGASDPDADATAVASAGSTLVYGGDPEASADRRWGELVWSENPVAPPDEVDAGTPVLDGYTHRGVLAAAERVVALADVDEWETVRLRASLADPRAVVGGVVAPLLARGTAALSGDGWGDDAGTGEGTAGDDVADVAVGGDDGMPEPRRVALDAVPL